MNYVPACIAGTIRVFTTVVSTLLLAFKKEGEISRTSVVALPILRAEQHGDA